MVQAGVVADCDGISISHSAQSCRIRFSGGNVPSLEALRDAWVDARPSDHPFLSRIVVALRAVAFARRRPVLIVHNCTARGKRSLFWNGTTLTPVESAGLLKFLGENEMAVYVSPSPLRREASVKQLRGIKDVTAGEYKELMRDAVCCPVPLWVESRSVNHFGMGDVSMTRKSLLFSAPGPLESEPFLRLPPNLRSNSQESRAGLAWTLYHRSQQERSRVCWVKDGVVCEEEFLNCPPSEFEARIFLPADDLEFDLTDFQLRFPEGSRQARIARALPTLAKEIRSNAELVDRSNVKRSRGSTWATAAVCLLGGVAFSVSTGGLALLTGAGLAAGLIYQGEVNEAKRPKESKLLRFADYLQGASYRG